MKLTLTTMTDSIESMIRLAKPYCPPRFIMWGMIFPAWLVVLGCVATFAWGTLSDPAVEAEKWARATREWAKTGVVMAQSVDAIIDMFSESGEIKNGVLKLDPPVPPVVRPPRPIKTNYVPDPGEGVDAIIRTLFGDSSYTQVAGARLKGIAGDPDNPILWVELAIAQSQLGSSLDEVSASLSVAASCAGNAGPGEYEYAMALSLASTHSYALSMVYAKKARKHLPDKAGILIRAIVYQSTGDSST